MRAVDEVYLPFVHHDCIHNQVIAITNRVCGVVPRPTRLGVTRLQLAAKQLSRQLPLTVPQDLYEMPLSYSGPKRTRYVQAADEYLAGGLTKRDATIKMFVKCEKLEPTAAKPNPDPRAIQFRNAKYCVVLSQHLKPIEPHLYQLSGVSAGVPHSRNVAKGLNQIERARLLVEKMNHFVCPVVVSLDMARFDKHVDRELLKVEHSVYTASNTLPVFAMLLAWQLASVCFSSRGIKYKVDGKRMSGDMNTALGNCILMLCMMLAFMHWCRKWDTLDDGDDCLLIIEEQDLARVMRTAKSEFLQFGMEVKVEGVAREIEDVVFCQSQCIQFAPGEYKFVRNPWKVLSTALTGTRHFHQPSVRARLLHSIGLCELVLSLGVPVLQQFALAILRNCGSGVGLELDPGSSIMCRVQRELRTLGVKQLQRLDPQPIQDCARVSFERAFGMEVNRQIQLEQWLETWTFEVGGLYEFPDEWDVPRWRCNPVDLPEVYLPHRDINLS